MNELINDLREENEQLKLALEKAKAERDEARRESLGVKSFLRRYRYRIKGGEQTQSYIDDVLLGRNGFINKCADDFAIEQQIKGAYLVIGQVSETGQFGWSDCQWLSDYAEEFEEQLRKELK